jgi:mxaJ protein
MRLVPLAFAVSIGCGLALSAQRSVARAPLRVCADPNNLPFSNQREQGFENKLAQLLARDLGRSVSYTWAAQRRGFLRNTLNADACDVVMGVPVKLEAVATTRPYYRSGYVLVSAPHVPTLSSLSAPQLHQLRIGVPLVGDDGANPPPLFALAAHGLLSNLRSYSVYGDYREDSPPAQLLRALRRGEIDVAIAWGPLAGYYAAHPTPALRYAFIPEAEAPPGLPFSFEIAIGVRHSDQALLGELDAALLRRKREVSALLASYGVPRLPLQRAVE